MTGIRQGTYVTESRRPAPPAAGRGPVLLLSEVTAGYGETVALRNVSFAVQPGQVTALLGPNGAGKTTVLRTASGIIRPRQGRVELDGDDVTSQPPFRRTETRHPLTPSQGRRRSHNGLTSGLSGHEADRGFGRGVCGLRCVVSP